MSSEIEVYTSGHHVFWGGARSYVALLVAWVEPTEIHVDEGSVDAVEFLEQLYSRAASAENASGSGQKVVEQGIEPVYHAYGVDRARAVITVDYAPPAPLVYAACIGALSLSTALTTLLLVKRCRPGSTE